MIRKKGTPAATGVDLFGHTITGVSLSRTTDGMYRVPHAWERPLPLGAHIGNAIVAPDAYRALAHGGRHHDDALVVGVYTSPDGMAHVPVDAKTAGEVLQRGRAQMVGMSAAAGVVGPEQHLMAVPRPHDREQPWAELRFHVHPYAVMQVLDLLQAERPAARPRVDARFLAGIRAFLAFGRPAADETLLFSHFDLLDSVHVVVHRRTVAYIYRRPKGLAQLAVEAAAADGEPLADAVHALYDGYLAAVVRESFVKEMRGAVSAARSRIRSQKVNEGFTLSRLVLSGPLADVGDLDGVTIDGAGPAVIQRFRPVVDLVTDAAVRARAGRFTVALGHALNDAAAKHDLLPVDLTNRVAVALLGRDRRHPLTIEERPLDVLQQGVPAARIGAGLVSGRAFTAIYLAPVAVGLVLAVRVGDGIRLRSEVRRLRADSAHAQARVTEAQFDRTTLSERMARRRALAALTAGRTAAPIALDAAVVAVRASSREAWLVTVRRDGDARVAYEGETLSPGALARFIDALRGQHGLDRVDLVRWEPTGAHWRFVVAASLTPHDLPSSAAVNPAASSALP